MLLSSTALLCCWLVLWNLHRKKGDFFLHRNFCCFCTMNKTWATTKIWTETKCFLVHPCPWIHAICPVFKEEAYKPEFFASVFLPANCNWTTWLSFPSFLHISSYQIPLWSIPCWRKISLLVQTLINQKLFPCVLSPLRALAPNDRLVTELVRSEEHWPCLAHGLPLHLSSLTPLGVSWASPWGRDLPFFPSTSCPREQEQEQVLLLAKGLCST